MSDFKTSTLDSSPLDPRKRVRYTTGLVMGVDEFQQDQLYLMERDHLHQRSLHGYGVVSGLGIETRKNGQGRWEVAVAPGLAVTPRGLSVCVDESQCANLDDWLDRHRDELLGSPPLVDPYASPPEPLPLWVVLCPRECETDPVPVLGDPCRTEEDATVPSRIADDFELKLSLEPPEQLEEEAVQRFGDLLRSFVIAESASPFLDQAAVEDLVRGLLPGSPPLPPPASPPEPLYLPADQAAEILTAAWRVWVTEVRPQIAGGAEGCAGGGESCVALGRLGVIVQDNDGNLEVASADPDVTKRPFLLHTRVIQEWLTLALRPPRHGDLLGLDDDDHLQYLLVNPTDRSLKEDLDASGNKVVRLAAATEAGDAVPFEQAVKVEDKAAGDLDGSYPDPQVVNLRGNPLAQTDPSPGNVLVWTGSAWAPQAPTGGGGTAGGDLSGSYPNPQVIALRGRGVATTAPSSGQALVWNGTVWTPQGAVVDGDTAGGDLSATYPNPQVIRLRGRTLSTATPAIADVLTWTGTAWTPQAPEAGGGEADLTRIIASSWVHGQPHTFQLSHNGTQIDAIAIAFGKDRGNFAPLDPATVDALVTGSQQPAIRLWMRQIEANTGLLEHLEVPLGVEPAVVDMTSPDGQVIQATTSSGKAETTALVLYLPDPFNVNSFGDGTLFRLEVVGDHILDVDGRAIDAEFVRSSLPTGDRAQGAGYGLQGGRFESWFTLIHQGIRSAGIAAAEEVSSMAIGDVDLNRATAKDLQTLPGVGPALAKRIVAERKKGGEFTSLEDLRRVSGISDNLIDRLREQDGES